MSPFLVLAENHVSSLGSLAHIGTFQGTPLLNILSIDSAEQYSSEAFHGAAVHGCCTVQASSMAMPPAEMVQMVRTCGLNRLVQYGTFVSAHIRAAQADEDVKRALQGMRQILYTGVALNVEDERWAAENGLRLTVCPCSGDGSGC
jgi:hypothetical protein